MKSNKYLGSTAIMIAKIGHSEFSFPIDIEFALMLQRSDELHFDDDADDEQYAEDRAWIHPSGSYNDELPEFNDKFQTRSAIMCEMRGTWEVSKRRISLGNCFDIYLEKIGE